MLAPAWVIGGVLLWRREPLGYVTGLGLLCLASFRLGLRFFVRLPRLRRRRLRVTSASRPINGVRPCADAATLECPRWDAIKGACR